jgi:glycosyltransferase involved in cell wall biosynthesis
MSTPRSAAAGGSDTASPRPRARVLHVITQLELGGAQQNTLYTCAHLDRARFEPILACGPGGYLDDEARALSDVPAHFLPALVRSVRPHRDLAALLALVRLMRRLRPEIVHTHSSKAGILGRAAAAIAGVPNVVHSIHGFGFHEGQRPVVRAAYILAEKAVAGSTDAFIAVSRANREEGIALGLFDPERCRVIRSGIDLSRYRSAGARAGELRCELGLAEGDPLVGMIACLKPQKAPLDFVDVARRVLEDEPRATFVLAGDGELRGPVEAAIAAVPGGAARIRLLGWRRDTDRIVADLDVALLTSRWEGLPRVLPEAMAAGRPVVATAVNGSPEAVTEGESGYLAPAGDTRRLAARVVELLRDPERRRRMGEEGRRRASEWDIDEMVRAQERLYEMLLQEAPRTSPAPSPRSSSHRLGL